MRSMVRPKRRLAHAQPPTAARSQAYSSGVSATAMCLRRADRPLPWSVPRRTPHDVPDTNANGAAASAPPRIRPITTQAASSGTNTTATAAQVFSEAPDRPACGLPTVTTTITAAVSRPAHIHSLPLTVRCDNLALSGSANSTEGVSSACTR